MKVDGRGASARPRVLVVDDDEAVRQVLRELLEHEYDVATVQHGAAALDLLGSYQPAVILVDLSMPFMDGWSFVEQCRRTTGSGSLIVVSAMIDAEESARRLGAAGFIRKPFDLDHVVMEIERCLASDNSAAAGAAALV